VARPSAGEVRDERGLAAVAVVELEAAVAPDYALRGRILIRVVRERFGRRAGEGKLGEDTPDLRGERAAGDGLAVVLGQHRLELVRVADPDRRRQLGRVPDEPRVAVVLGRAGLPGGDTVGQGRALTRAGSDHAF